MKAVIVGAGVVGVASAFALAEHGHDVTVVEREPGPGLGTSYANGALLTPSMSEPWNSPGCWRHLLASLVVGDSALKLRLRAVPSLVRWGISFLKNSAAKRFTHNTLRNFSLASYSLQLMQGLRDRTGINYLRSTGGTLRVFRNQQMLNRALESSKRIEAAGISMQLLSTSELVALEPGLKATENQLVGGLHYPFDEVGDAHGFCTALAKRAAEIGVKFEFHTKALSFEIRGGRVVALESEGQRFAADCFVVACGSYSPVVLRHLGVRIPVRPVKGYSVTLDADVFATPIRLPIVDDEKHVVVVPVGNSVRVAGMAEFAGYDLRLDSRRIEELVRVVGALLPGDNSTLGSARGWCGLRAVSEDGVPIIGETSLGGLFVNTGHGHLGWTMAAGSAQLLADLISGVTPSVDATMYSLHRFAS